MLDLGKIMVTPMGEWDADTAYEPLCLVSYNKCGYLSLRDNTGVTPGVNDDIWMPLYSADALFDKLQSLVDSLIVDVREDEEFAWRMRYPAILDVIKRACALRVEDNAGEKKVYPRVNSVFILPELEEGEFLDNTGEVFALFGTIQYDGISGEVNSFDGYALVKGAGVHGTYFFKKISR